MGSYVLSIFSKRFLRSLSLKSFLLRLPREPISFWSTHSRLIIIGSLSYLSLHRHTRGALMHLRALLAAILFIYLRDKQTRFSPRSIIIIKNPRTIATTFFSLTLSLYNEHIISASLYRNCEPERRNIHRTLWHAALGWFSNHRSPIIVPVSGLFMFPHAGYFSLFFFFNTEWFGSFQSRRALVVQDLFYGSSSSHDFNSLVTDKMCNF